MGADSLLFDRRGNTPLVVLAQVGRHGEAQAAGGGGFGYGEVAGFVVQVRKCALEVKGGCVVGDGWDAGGLQALGQGISVFGQEGVLGVDRVVAFADDGGLDARRRR